MEEDILNYSPTFMFRGTPYIRIHKKSSYTRIHFKISFGKFECTAPLLFKQNYQKNMFKKSTFYYMFSISIYTKDSKRT